MNVFITKNGEQLGPYTLAELNQLRADGKLSDADLAWHEGLANWIPLTQIAGVTAPPAPLVGEPSTKARWITAVVTSVILFVILFFVIFFVTVMICGAIVGGQAALAQHAQGYEAGHQVGEEAGKAFGKTYGPMIAGLSALASLVLSVLLAWWISFSNLLPWCRR